MKRHLVLTGFMAAGKSTIGKRLARKLGLSFYDLDELVVKAHGAISDIFYNEGEKAFRRYEHDAIAQVFEHGDPGIVAAGGGAVTFDRTLELIKKKSYRVFVKVTPEQIITRLRHSKVIRPLIGPAPALHTIRELYEKRMPHYAHADFVIEADHLSTAQIVDQIAQWMQRKKIAW